MFSTPQAVPSLIPGMGAASPLQATSLVPGMPAVPPQQPLAPPSLRSFDDPGVVRSKIYERTLAAASSFPAVENTKRRLTLVDPHFDGPEEYSLTDQKRAVLEGKSLGRRLRGTWVLSDLATGEPIASKKTTVATVPYMTPRGTFIMNGVEYTLAHQFRLRSGVYSRTKDNGEIESHVNILPGQGLSHRIELEPQTGLFRMKIGQARLPLVPILRTLGVTDKQLKEAWGDDLARTNIAKDDPAVVAKLHGRLVRGPAAADSGDRAGRVADVLRAMRLDPEVTGRTLGKPYSSIDQGVYLDATKKMLAISRGEQSGDDRDHLAFMTLHGPEDLISERFGRDKNLLRRALWKATVRNDLKSIGPNFLSKSVQAALMSSGLGQPGENTNPITILEQQGRVTRMGEGGIPSVDSIPDDSRNVQPSHLGLVDFIVTPESLAAGVDSRLAHGARKDADGRLYTTVIDAATGERTHKHAQDLADAVVAFPGEMDRKGSVVRAMVNGKIIPVLKKDVQYALPDMDSTLSPISNLVPMKSGIKGQRLAMAGRMMTQALPLVDPETPFVQSGMPGEPDKSFEDYFGKHAGAVRSELEGTVITAKPGMVEVRDRQGQLHQIELADNFPFNRKSGLHQTPVVTPGQPIKPGDLIARSNYTNQEGSLALGRNARVAYVPFDGANYEDAFVISDSFAKKMTSDHLYQHTINHETGLRVGSKDHLAAFPGRYPRRILKNFDEAGIIKPGTVLHHGDPMILAVKERELTQDQVHRGHSKAFSDQTQVWEHEAPGVVTDTASTPDGITVVVKSTMGMKVGDKLSGRQGDKGLVSRIYPDGQMPHDKDGKPYEILVNPLGLLTRTNPSQMIEGALGKIAEVTGKPYKMPDFKTDRDLTEYAMQELEKHGLSDLETIRDPRTGRNIPDVFTGNRWFMKLHHTSESKNQGRGTGGYSADETPSKGGAGASKRVALMDVNALLAHGATGVINDARAVKGQANPEYWDRFMAGHTPPLPKVPLVHQKFVNLLKSSGINVVREGQRLNIMALTDRDVDSLAGDREITNADTVDFAKGLKTIPGGLFDPKLTGGHGGTNWSALKLAEPVPNPIMESPIRRVLGLTENKFRDVLAGKEEINGMRGPHAIKSALENIDLDQAIDRARAEMNSGKKTARDEAVRKLGYLKAAKKYDLHPKDWMLSRVPVLPPRFRPVSVMKGTGSPLVSDPNYLYKELFEANQVLGDLKQQVTDVGAERLNVYDSLKAVTGLGDPLHPKNQERRVKGALKSVFGTAPKYGFVQRKLLSGTVDLIGRGAITPNPDLDMDSVGLPESKAWSVYSPFIVRRLVRAGMKHLDAARAVKEQDPAARKALQAELQDRPVILTRAPVLHKYGVMAFWPKLTKGDTIQISPFVTTGFGADFDGDQMNYSVPASHSAVEDAIEKMLPSKNLFSAANFKVHQVPSKEFAGGLYAASVAHTQSKRPRVFSTAQDAARAYARGEIGVDHPIEILHH